MYKRLMIPMIVLLAANLFVTWVVPDAEAVVRYYRCVDSVHSNGTGSVTDQLFGVYQQADGKYAASCNMEGKVFCDPVKLGDCTNAIGGTVLGGTDFVTPPVDFTYDSEAETYSATTTAKMSSETGQNICNYYFGFIGVPQTEEEYIADPGEYATYQDYLEAWYANPQNFATIFDKFWPVDVDDALAVPDFFALTTYSDGTPELQELCSKRNTPNEEGELVADCQTHPFKVPCCGGEHTLTVGVEGQGTVTSAPAGINCDGSTTDGCTVTYDVENPGSPAYDTCPMVVLTAEPECDDPGTWGGSCSVFTGWSGDGCSGTDPFCTVASKGNPTVTAAFETSYYTLTVYVVGDGTKDRVYYLDPGEDIEFDAHVDENGDTVVESTTYCYGTCYTRFAPGTSITVKRKGGTFGDWNGVCDGVPNSDDTCTIVMDGNKIAEAVFLN